MRNRTTLLAGVFVALAVLIGGSVAIANGRLVGEPEPAPVNLEERKAAEGVDESDPEPTPEELAVARALAEREALEVEAGSYQRVHEEVVSTRTDVALPNTLGAAVVPELAARLVSGDRIPILTTTKQQGSTTVEKVHYSDGSALVTLTWQNWPSNVDPQRLIREGSEVEYRGNIDLIIRDYSDDGMISVAAFDGSILARVTTHDAKDLSLDDVIDMALQFHAGILEARE